jgi:hypothetical protein
LNKIEMQSRFLKVVFLCLIAIFAMSAAEAQLLHERNKLKTEKRKKKGFTFFKKSVRTVDGRPEIITFSAPRFTKGVKRKGISVSPRYSQSVAGRGGYKPTSTRYSQTIAGQGGFKPSSPRYSQSIAGQGGFKPSSPRYSQSIAGQGGFKPGSPRYSQSIAGQGGFKPSSPRYSQSIAGQGGFKPSSPRYSQSRAGQGGFKPGRPRYSQSIAGQGGFKPSSPRYSQSIAGQGSNRTVNPRFSKDPGNFGSSWVPTPKTASNEGMVFNFPSRAYKANRIKNNGEGDYNPKYNGVAKRGGKDFHPSSAYRSAKYKNSKFVRNSLQKFNILMVKANGNKTQPKGVNKKSKKTKYDKDEAEIWNNKEREYTHN